ncbi:MAG TPA: hypothetical protein G4O07_04530 [Dehalococcoidia bacterium]|nr:hypothetical protein [Dehalococcoidia bacterium]
MATELERYLKNVRENLRLDPGEEEEVLTELETHAEDRLLEMKEAGLSDEDALKECIGLFGSAKLVAHQIYEVHSQGTWRQALLASLPHLLFAMLFVLKWWGIGWLPVLVGSTVAIAIYGWCRGKPNWLFPWLGYALLPVVAAGLLLLYLPTGWAWATILVYIPLVLWLLCYITIKSIKRDWLYIAFMLLPVPSLVGWLLAAQEEVGFTGFNLGRLNDFAPWIGLSFLVLAASAVIFVRLRKRRIKLAALGISGVLTLAMIAFAGSRVDFPAFLALTLLLLIFLLVPAILDRRLRQGDHPAVT